MWGHSSPQKLRPSKRPFFLARTPRAWPLLKQSQSRLPSEPPFMLPRFPRRRYATRHKLGIQRHTGYKGHEIATLEARHIIRAQLGQRGGLGVYLSERSL